MERIEHHAMFGGWQDVYLHRSSALKCDMKFAVYLPPLAATKKCPVLYWLSGLTCTEQNFITKSGAQRYAAEYGIILVAPDTSPRGADVPDDPAYDLGQGAGFYLDAREHPWAENFRMEMYVVEELPALISAAFPVNGDVSVSGHSMGGHGALTLALRYPGHYRSVSAFSPIVAPSQVPWGKKAFQAYFGDDTDAWNAHDAVALVKAGAEKIPMRIDQGLDDEFLVEQLRPHLLQEACVAANFPLTLNLRPDFDHSYYFIASFIGEHIRWHAKALGVMSRTRISGGGYSWVI